MYAHFVYELQHERKQLYAGKKKCPSLFLAADPLFLVIQKKKNKKQNKKNVPMPGPRCVITFFFVFFFIQRAQYLVSVKGYRATWSKKSPCSGSLRRRTAELI